MPLNRLHLVAAGLVLALSPLSWAQQGPRGPHIGFVYPAGGRAGTTFEVTVGGQFLDGVNAAHVTGPGVTAEVSEYLKPMTNKDALILRDKLKELQDKRFESMRKDKEGAATRPVWTGEDERQVEEIRKKLSTFVRRPSSPAIVEIVTLRVTLADNAPVGQREVRLQTPLGLSNPMVFCVDTLPEFSEKPARNAGEPTRSVERDETKVTLPAIVNGQVLAGGVDRIRFQARKGQQLVVATRARELCPYVPDAVPGWFQATLALYNAKGKELAYDDDFRFDPDPVLMYTIPENGEYYVEIKDSIYRGREDFVYRVAIGELPFITSIFPLGGKAGERTPVELKGRNLSLTRVTHDATTRPVGLYDVSVRKGDVASNRMPFAVDDLPEVAEHEPNDKVDAAQKLTLPAIVNGRVGKPGDDDVYAIDGRAGDEVVAEVRARRLDSPVDSVLRVTDAAGKQIGFNDDYEDKGAGLSTHHADSYVRAKLPADGTYYVHLGDAQAKGGLEYGYRLRVGPPRPDFELRVVPSSVTVRGGSTAVVTVYALRRDGFDGQIGLGLKDATEGLAIGGAWVPAGQDKVKVTLTLPPGPNEKPVSVRVEGRATVAGRELVRAAVPADDMMQAFLWRHLVPAQELMMSAGGRGSVPGGVRVAGEGPVKIPANGTARVRFVAAKGRLPGKVHVELVEAPEGIRVRGTTTLRDGVEMVLQCDGEKAKAGLRGNLIVNAFGEPAVGPDGKAKGKRWSIGMLPAVAFEVVSTEGVANAK